MAFFQAGLVPRIRPRVTSFRRICMVLTPVTVTENSSRSAWRIWCLLAPGWTTKAYSFRA